MNIMSFVIIGIILLVLGNTMVMSARERTHEYAVLKALGFSAAQIFFLIAGESLILSLLGSALGLGVTLPAVAGFETALPKGWFPVFYIKPETVVMACAAGLLVGDRGVVDSDAASGDDSHRRRVAPCGIDFRSSSSRRSNRSTVLSRRHRLKVEGEK